MMNNYMYIDWLEKEKELIKILELLRFIYSVFSFILFFHLLNVFYKYFIRF
jgi:hypothetical protein